MKRSEKPLPETQEVILDGGHIKLYLDLSGGGGGLESKNHRCRGQRKLELSESGLGWRGVNLVFHECGFVIIRRNLLYRD